VAQASRNGFFFVLDRTNGERLLTAPFIETNWTSGIDARGRPVALPGKSPRPDGTLLLPGSDGATNWMSPSFDPTEGLFYVMARRVFSIFYYTATGKPEGWAGRDHNLWQDSTIRAIDYRTGKIRWNHELGPGESVAGILATAGNLLFTGDAQGNLLVLDAATGKTLWHVNAGGNMVSSPMTYELDGRQYVVEGVQGVLYAWALPQSEP
jgi:alcohol dehydrogenase (cytochrome c)